MAFRHGTNARVYYHTLDFSDYVEEVDIGFERDLAEFAPLSASWKQNLPGLRTCTISFAGLHDSSEDAIQDVAWGIFDGDTNAVFAYLPDGDTLENTAYCGESKVTSDKVVAGDDVIRAPVEVIGTDQADRAKVAHTLLAETATGSETSIDDGAAAPESYGFEAYLICTSLTATDTIDVSIQDSDDDGVGDAYADAVAFTQLSAIGSEHKSVAAAANVLKRYVRVAWTITDNSGDPSVEFFVAYRRRTS